MISNNINIVAQNYFKDWQFKFSAVNKQKEEMGKLIFTIDEINNRTIINVIETNQEYKRQGIATALLVAMEYVSLKHFKISTIVGDFGPFKRDKHGKIKDVSEEEKQNILDFYGVNGYAFDRRTRQIEKKISKPAIEYKKVVHCSLRESKCFLNDNQTEEQLEI